MSTGVEEAGEALAKGSNCQGGWRSAVEPRLPAVQPETKVLRSPDSFHVSLEGSPSKVSFQALFGLPLGLAATSAWERDWSTETARRDSTTRCADLHEYLYWCWSHVQRLLYSLYSSL